MRSTTPRERSRGFTLVELLIVVAIIAIIAAIAVPSLVEAQARAKVSRAKSDLRTIATALEAYRVDNNDYPPQDPFLVSPSGSNTPYFQRLLPITTPVAYATSQPLDPFNAVGDPVDGTLPSGYDYAVEDRWANEAWDGVSGVWYSRATWMLTGSGPDSLNISATTGAGLGWHYPYDPTNGTVSHGQVMRLGPGDIPPSLSP